jgi:hypothetical protein
VFVNANHLQGLTLGHYGSVEIYTDESEGRIALYTTPPTQEFVCSTGLCHFTLTQTNVGIGERGMEAYEAAKKRGWVGVSDERLMEMPKQEPVAIYCKAKRENNGVCPNHNLQCGWPKCNEPPTPVTVISSKQLSTMFQDLKGIDTNQSGYHWRVGYNAALRQAMDYSMPLYTSLQPQRTWVGLTEQEHIELAIECGCLSADWLFYGAALERKIKEKNGI